MAFWALFAQYFLWQWECPVVQSSNSAQQSPDAHALITRVAPVYVRPVLEEAARHGVSLLRLCQGLAISADDMDFPGVFLTHHEALTVIRRALPAIARPYLGLDLGLQCNIVRRGVQALGLLASATLGEATTLALRFPVGAGYLLALHEGRSESEHVLTADSIFGNHDIQPFLVDQLFSSIVNARRLLTGENYSPMVVELVHQRPANVRPYEDHFRCQVRFGGSRNRIVSSIKWQDYPLPMASTRSYRLACQLMDLEAAEAVGASAIGLASARAIRAALPHIPTPTEVAASLNLSERTLRRKLIEASVSYQCLLDDIRKSRALELISNGWTSLAHIAAQTGFSDVRAFRRAFKRWTGYTPGEMRDQVRR